MLTWLRVTVLSAASTKKPPPFEVESMLANWPPVMVRLQSSTYSPPPRYQDVLRVMLDWLMVAVAVVLTYTPPPLLAPFPSARFTVIELPSIARLPAPSAQTAPPSP